MVHRKESDAMKAIVPVILFAALACGLVSCEEETVPSRVNGYIRCGQCQGEFPVDGNLAESNAKYYGYCEKDGDNLTFVVATDDKAHATSSSDFYFRLEGVQGPPTVGYHDPAAAAGVPKDDDALHTGFTSCTIKNVNEYSFGPDDAASPELCMVQLYAEAGEGELDPNQKQFDYFVWFKCQTISVAAVGGAETLTSVESELFFANCN
jgi:hypothetical protein